MNAVILAAGIGRRFGPLKDNIPKCLIRIKGKPILDHQLELLKRNGICKISIVIGAKGRCWTQENYNKIQARIKGTLINYENISKKRNFSLSIGIKNLDSEPLLIVDGDLFFEEVVLEAVLNSRGDMVLLARDCKGRRDSKNKIATLGDRVLAMGSRVSLYPWKVNAGLIKVSANLFPVFKKAVFNPAYLDSSFGALINYLCPKNDIRIVSRNTGWININTLGDLNILSLKR